MSCEKNISLHSSFRVGFIVFSSHHNGWLLRPAYIFSSLYWLSLWVYSCFLWLLISELSHSSLFGFLALPTLLSLIPHIKSPLLNYLAPALFSSLNCEWNNIGVFSSPSSPSRRLICRHMISVPDIQRCFKKKKKELKILYWMEKLYTLNIRTFNLECV